VVGAHLGHDLLDRFGACSLAESRRDFAELARHRAAPRRLDRGRRIRAARKEIVPGRRGVPHVDELSLDVPRCRRSSCEVIEELRPCVLGLTLEDVIGVPRDLVDRRGFDDRPADRDDLSALAERVGELEDALALDVVAGNPDDIGDGVEIDRLDVLVDELHGVRGRRQRGERWKSQRRMRVARAVEIAAEREVPKRRRERRIDEEDLHDACAITTSGAEYRAAAARALLAARE